MELALTLRNIYRKNIFLTLFFAIIVCLNILYLLTVSRKNLNHVVELINIL